MERATVNICIVHFNTPLLTECLIKSINKFTPNSKIYIFDNSDKHPFTYRQDNIIYFDNTKGQIINFEEWLEQYPNKEKSRGKLNNFGSAKHCYTIQKCIELINDNFILLDSDVLLKKDISCFYDINYPAVGKAEYQTNCHDKRQHSIKRLLPYICFVNAKMCKYKGISYFDENYMNGLYVSETADLYDTGGGFLKSIEKQKLHHKEINIYDFIIHKAAGSWSDTSSERWLYNNINLFKDKIIISLTSHGKRLNYVREALGSILNQDLKADKIILNICKKDEKNVSSLLKQYAQKNNIEIYYYDNDIGPHAKYFYTMKRYKNECIITIDDDIIYKKDVISSLYFDYLKNPNCIIARRVHKIKYKNDTPTEYKNWFHEYTSSTIPSFDIFATGVGGVLYPPDILQISDSCLSDINKSLYADDIYLKYRSLELKVKTKWVRNNSISSTPLNKNIIKNSGLALSNNLKNRNDTYINNLKMKREKTTNKYVVYTCITNNYDAIREISNPIPGYDFICFTDNKKLTSNTWMIDFLPDKLKGLSPVRQQRYIKTHPHEFLSDYEVSIWIDGNVDILQDPTPLINDFCIEIPTHPERKCIYEEGIACIKQHKDTSTNVNKQLNRYKREGFPKNFGLPQSCIIIRHHNNPDCIKIMNEWWNEIEKGSHRDQLSFSYVLWKNQNVKIYYLDKKLFNSQYFKWNVKHEIKCSAS